MSVDYTMNSSHMGNKDVYLIGWVLTNGTTGTPLPMSKYADRSVQVSGTFGAGGTVVIEGSNDGVSYYTLTDPQGNNLSFTSAKIEAVTEMVAFIRPRVTAGDGTTNLTITLAARA